MKQPKMNRVLGILASAWRGVAAARKITMNLIFLAIVFALLAVALRDGKPNVPDSTALVIAPKGQIVEQLVGDPVDKVKGMLTGNTKPETLGRDLVRTIRAAKDDKRVKALLIDLNSLTGARLAMLQDLKAAIEDFKESEKPVIATSDFYFKTQYYLASAADEIYLTDMGAVILDGYSRYRTYYHDGLERLEVDSNIVRVGEFKSAVEPFLRDSMSEKAKEANLEWLGDLWRSYLADVAAARGLTPEALTDGIENLNAHLNAAGGDLSQMALDAGLVDHVGGRDLLRQRMIELVGEDEEEHSFNRIGHAEYLEVVGEDVKKGKSGKVAVIIAKGTILDGSHPPGTIGGDSTAALIRRARNDEDVKALVLRVDSGGGSAFASEVIRQEFVLAREAGKKVVVSMAGVAASGGYWISTASDEIWANPNTITGSIGIFGMLPTVQKPLAKYLGIRVDGVGTTWIGGQGRPDRALDPRLKELVTQAIQKGYRDFLARVAEARNMTTEEVDVIARGRVWSGIDAHEMGLVDKLGGLDEAIASAAELAELGDDYSVEYVEKELDWKDKIVADLLTRVAGYLQANEDLARPSFERRALGALREFADILSGFNDPNGMYAYCFCEAE
ncbi:MAG: signal peptide peptidase SppA [Acidobacteria bacterium]|nr:signal peptide peptidase SppA [Acidobacteriota bacterium]